MKFTNLKNVAWVTIALSTTGLFASHSYAAENDGQQSALQDGLEGRLTSDQLAEYKVYADKSNAAIGDLLKEVRRMPYAKAKVRLMEGFSHIAKDSAPKGPEILLRSILNRAVDMVTRIDANADASRPGVVDQEVRILRRSAELAVKYYPNDKAYLDTNASLDPAYAKFGVEYAKLIMQVNESLVSSKAQYNLGITELVHLENDLHHDRSNKAYGRVIRKLGDFLAAYPDPDKQQSMSSTECVNKMRDIRRVYFDSMEILEGTQVSNN